MRAALYWAPAVDDPLHAAGSAWLGRDAELGVAAPQPAVPGLAAATREARRYGLHATLRPPMRLATGWGEFCEAATQVARETAPFVLPPLAVTEMRGVLMLRETAPCPELQAFAERCVRATNKHRLAPDEAELARRRAPGLTAAQEAMLTEFGYPYVLDEWFFHVTLTGRLDPAVMQEMRAAAETHFAEALAVPSVVREVVIFTEREAGEDFLIAERLQLGR